MPLRTQSLYFYFLFARHVVRHYCRSWHDSWRVVLWSVTLIGYHAQVWWTMMLTFLRLPREGVDWVGLGRLPVLTLLETSSTCFVIPCRYVLLTFPVICCSWKEFIALSALEHLSLEDCTASLPSFAVLIFTQGLFIRNLLKIYKYRTKNIENL